MHLCMNWDAVSFDWNQVRAFLATVEEGSLSKAAKSLGQTQPTLGRQVSALEESLGVTLFERVGRSLVLSESGLALLEHVQLMGEAANRISLAASGQSQAIEGVVRITASDATCSYILPDVIPLIQAAAPNIEVEIISSNDIRDLLRREADISLRHARPTQPDLVAKVIFETTAHVYGTQSYFEKHGRPKTIDELSKAQFVGLEHSTRLLQPMASMGLNLTAKNFKLVANTSVAGWEMVKRGLGLGLMSVNVAQLTPEIEMVLPDLPPAPVQTWLVTHRELHTSRKIRLVFDILSNYFAQRY